MITTLPSERGRFSCVVPNAQGNNQTYYVNICMCYIFNELYYWGIVLTVDFYFTVDIDRVTISPSQSTCCCWTKLQCHMLSTYYNYTSTWKYTNSNFQVVLWTKQVNANCTTGHDVTVSVVQNNSNTYVSTIRPNSSLSLSCRDLYLSIWRKWRIECKHWMISLKGKRKCQTYIIMMCLAKLIFFIDPSTFICHYHQWSSSVQSQKGLQLDWLAQWNWMQHWYNHLQISQC